MKPHRLTGEKGDRLSPFLPFSLIVFLKTAKGILILCTLLVVPGLAQIGNPSRAEKSTEGRPDLSGLPANEAKAIKNACSYTRKYEGPGEYYRCLQSGIATLQKSGGRPDLSGLPANEAKAIENACSYTRKYEGPGEYYRCLQSEIATLQKFLGPTTKGLRTNEPTPGLAGRPIEEATTGKGKEQRVERLDRKKSPEGHTAPPKEEFGDRPSPDSPSRISPQHTYANQPTKKPVTDSFLRALGVVLLLFIGRGIYKRVSTKPCIHCDARTANNTRICDACRRRIDNENAKAQERERQEREARKRAEENKRREEERAQGQRKRGEDARPKKPSSGQGFDPYEVLQVTRGASKQEIKAAYLELIKQYHPDKVSHLGKEFQEIAKEKTQAINRAYEMLISS